MEQEKMSPLRARMLEDMRIRGMGDKAQKSHIRAIKDFAAFLEHSPDTATPEELRAYQLHMTDTGVTASTFNTRIVALRFFFGITCGRETAFRRAGGGPGLSQPVYPSGRDLEPSLGQRGCRHRRIPLEGLPHQTRGPPKGHASRRARVHPPLPDTCPTRWLPPHPSLRPAGQCNAEGQHRPHPRSVGAAATRTGSAGRNGGCLAHPARTMPQLRWPHARGRNLPARPETNVARTTPGAGCMTGCLSISNRAHRQRQPAPGRTVCAELTTRPNTALMRATWGALGASTRELSPPIIAQQDANPLAKTTVPSTTCTQYP